MYSIYCIRKYDTNGNNHGAASKHFTTLHTLQHYPYSIGKRESKSYKTRAYNIPLPINAYY